MKLMILIFSLFLNITMANAQLSPKFTCQSPLTPKGRGYLIEVIYSPWQKSYQLGLSYMSEFGLEPITSFYTRPGYTQTQMIIQDVVSESNFPPFNNGGQVFSPSNPRPKNGKVFKLVVDKKTLEGGFTYNEVRYGTAPKSYQSKIKCQITATTNVFPPLPPKPGTLRSR